MVRPRLSRPAPVVSILDEALPSLEDLEPEELKYLKKICKALKELEEASGLYPQRDRGGEDSDDLFDADELGLDPEHDNERW